MTNKSWLFRRAKVASGVALAALLVGPMAPALAQDTAAEARIRKMEAEIRALQRKVFPGGDGRFFEAEIKPPGAAPSGPQEPSASAVTNLLQRMEALETQIATLTGQIEQNANRLTKLEAAAAIAAPAAISGASATSSSAPSSSPPSSSSSDPSSTPAAQANLDAMTGGASATPASASPAAAVPSDARVAAVSAIVKPQTEDAGDDEYSYGFRLWDANFFPEAQQQLKLFVEKYPNHWRISWGRNLLGRAYLDDGNAREAAKWFLQNYQADKTGGRAPDSLLYLAIAMKQLKDTKRACISLAEFSEFYAAEAAGRLKSLYDATRNGLDCSG